MDRGKSFRILGLSETATKEQIEAAYAKKVARYKGPDYAEEPAYVERKLTELHQAYAEARDLAKDGPNTFRVSRTECEAPKPAKKETTKVNRLLKEERDAAGHNAREKFHQWMEQRDEKKNRSSFEDKQAAKTSKKKVELKLPELKKPDFSEMKKKLNEVFPDNEIFQEPKHHSSDTSEIFVEPGGVETKKDKTNDEFWGTMISIAVALVIFFFGSCEDTSIDDSYEEPAFSYIYDQAYEDINTDDSRVAVLADQSYILLTDAEEHGTATLHDDIQSEYQEKADLFAKNYWGKDSIPEVTSYLYDTYDSYMTDEDEPLSTQLDAIFAFYGFASLDIASWYDQPYTGSRIQSYGDYLEYLNQFFTEQQ